MGPNSMEMKDYTKTQIIDDSGILTANGDHKTHSSMGSNSHDTNVPLYKRKDIIWKNVVSNFIFHAIALYGFFTFPYIQRFRTFLWFCFMVWFTIFGITAGVHRLWSHRSYKAKMPLRILLLIAFASAGQYSIFWWVRDHRIHHKFSDTEKDPHNPTRGFFFAHVGWLMTKRRPEAIAEGKKLDMSDILNDPVVQFGEKYFAILKTVFCYVLPVIIPVYGWNEEWYYAILSQVFMRYIWVLNVNWSINSFAHLYGIKPYDKEMRPTDNLMVSIVSFGEGWHNYHHVFPWDYNTGELPAHFMSTTTLILQMFAKIGWAYDLKQPSEELIRSVISRRGDGSSPIQEVPPPDSNEKKD